MKITARIAIFLSSLFAFACFAMAYQGFKSLGGIADLATLQDAKGYAWFWVFIGCVILAIAVASWWITATEKE